MKVAAGPTDRLARAKAATRDKVRLRKGSSLKDRLFRASLGVLVLLLAVPGSVTWADQHPGPTALLALPLAGFLIFVAALESNVAWIITCDGILISEQRPLGHLRKRPIRSDGVSGFGFASVQAQHS